MQVNGYVVKKAPNGAWWVRQGDGRQAWRFAARPEALRFAQKLCPAARVPDRLTPPPLPGRIVRGQRRRA